MPMRALRHLRSRLQNATVKLPMLLLPWENQLGPMTPRLQWRRNVLLPSSRPLQLHGSGGQPLPRDLPVAARTVQLWGRNSRGQALPLAVAAKRRAASAQAPRPSLRLGSGERLARERCMQSSCCSFPVTLRWRLLLRESWSGASLRLRG